MQSAGVRLSLLVGFVFSVTASFAVAGSEPVERRPADADSAVRAAACAPGITTPGIVEFIIPTADSRPLGIAAGPDCALWFTETRGNRIGRISLRGEITEFAIPTPSSDPARIVTGPDGALWFTETMGNRIGRITTAGVFTEFALPSPESFPVGITAGPDGNLWFTEQGVSTIGKMTPAGALTEYVVPPLGMFPALPRGITAGPDGNLWFSEYYTGRVGRITTDGSITLFSIEPSCCASLGEITTGPDGNLWFTEQWENSIVKITPAGSVEYFRLASPGQGQAAEYTAFGIAAADGAIWFTHGSGWIGRLTMAGVVTRFDVPTANSDPEIITVGPDGSLWFTEMLGNRIGRLSLSTQTLPRRRAVRH